MASYSGKIRKIKVLALDFDGVLTDGFVYFGQDGYEMVKCSRRDSLGINMLQKTGVAVVVISKEKNKIVSERCKKIGIQCLQGIDDKSVILKKFAKDKRIKLDEICFIGDDVNDLGAMSIAGLSVAVSDAEPEVKKNAAFSTHKRGGKGAVRELCDLIISEKIKNSKRD